MTVYYSDATLELHQGDAARVLSSMDPSAVDCVVTSPPYYGLRDYGGQPEQIGLEASPAEYVAALAEAFAEVHRVLAEDGTCWLNLGDSYAGSWGNQGHKPGRVDRQVSARRDGGYPDRARTGSIKAGEPAAKNLVGIPWRVAFTLQDAGWYLRNAIVWHKANAMPESVRDRVSTRYELIFLLTKSPRYWFDLDAIREPCSPNKPWGVTATNKAGEATAGLRDHRADQHQTELSPDYCAMALRRCQDAPLFTDEEATHHGS